MRREKGGSLWRGQRDEGHQERNTEYLCRGRSKWHFLKQEGRRGREKMVALRIDKSFSEAPCFSFPRE